MNFLVKTRLRKIILSCLLSTVAAASGYGVYSFKSGVNPVEPTPAPIAKSLSAVGIWTALGSSAELANIAHSHDLAVFIASQGGTWLILDPIMADTPNHPGWVDKWLKVLTDSGKSKPAIIWHDNGRVVGINSLSDTTTSEDILAMAKGYIKSDIDCVYMNGRSYSTGLKRRDTLPGKVMFHGSAIPQISAILKPLKEKDYPTVDLRTQITRIKDQNGYGTCWAQSACTVMEAIRYAQFGPVNDIELSPNNLATRVGGWNGAYLSDAMKALLSDGVVPMVDQPNYVHALPKDWKKRAEGYKLLAVYDSPDRDTMGYLAAALKQGWVTEIGIAVGSGFNTDKEGYVSYARGSGRGGHAVTACGLKKANGKWWVLIANSWGTKWGQGGFGWIESKFVSVETYSDMWVAVVVSAAPTDKHIDPEQGKRLMQQYNQLLYQTATQDSAPKVDSTKCADIQVVMYTAKWCAACKSAKASLASVAKSKADIIYVDIDEQPDLSSSAGIKRLPTFDITYDGKTTRNYSVAFVLSLIERKK
jgi:thiol-disulfide isomerase/thioredoxin